MTSGSGGERRSIIHSQKPNVFVCGLSTRKIFTPWVDPEQHHVAQRLPQRPPVFALEVERIDVLVFLRRVLRVLDRAIGPVPEPFGMLPHPRMIGRALPCEVERDLEAEALGLGDETRRSPRASPGRVRRPCVHLRPIRSPTGCRDRRARRRARCSGPFESCGRSDGSAAGRRTSNPISAMRGSRVAASRRFRCDRDRAGRTREHLVPRAEPRTLPVHPHAQRGARRRPRSIGVRIHPAEAIVVERRANAFVHGTAFAQGFSPLEKPEPIERAALRRTRSPSSAAARSARTDASRTSAEPSSSSTDTSWPAAVFTCQSATPGQEPIDPRDDLIFVPAGLEPDGEGGCPFVGAGGASVIDVRATGRSVTDRTVAASTSEAADHVVAVRKDGRNNLNGSPTVRLTGQRPLSMAGGRVRRSPDSATSGIPSQLTASGCHRRRPWTLVGHRGRLAAPVATGPQPLPSRARSRHCRLAS